MDAIDIWVFLLGLAVILYVVLDGFSLGIGILFPLTRSEEERDQMIESIAPVWDANQTWLVFGGGGLFVAFPLMYGVLFSALYVPLFTMLYGLIFRGVSFEFRANAQRKAPWNHAFFLGSLVAVIAQGMTLGGVLSGIKSDGTAFTGGTFDWLTPFSLAAAAGLIAGYALLGSTYLIIKTSGRVQQRASVQAFTSALAVLNFQLIMIAWTPFHFPHGLAGWLTPPRVYFVWAFPGVSLVAFALIIKNLRMHAEFSPFLWSVVFFLAGYLGLFASIYPYAVPPSITFRQAAAEMETLRFTLWGAALILPVVLAYTVYSYTVFKGKVGQEGYYH